MFFPIISLCQFGPEGLGRQDLKRGLLNIVIYTQNKSCGPHGFREEDIFYVSTIITL